MSRRLVPLFLIIVLPVAPSCSDRNGGGATASPPGAVGAGEDGGLARGDDAGLADGGTASDAGELPPSTLPPPYLGANVEPGGGVVFRVWTPHATGAAVRGDFIATDVPMRAAAGGVYEAHVPLARAGSTYRFQLTTPSGSLTRIDPYCRELIADACRVVDPNAYPWSLAPRPRLARASAVVYELHVASFSRAAGGGHGTYASTRDALPALAELGVNVIELMPVQSFGGGANGWGYNPQLFHAPMPALGSLDDFRALVDRAHALGIAVWVDTVVNHADGWNRAPMRCFDGECPNGSAGAYFFAPGPYASTPWGPRPSYATPEVATLLVSTVDTWMSELRADGFRVDSVSNVRALDGQGVVPGGKDLLVRVNDRVHALGGLSVAEDLKGYGELTVATKRGGFGFDAQWDGFGYVVNEVLVPQGDAGRDLGRVVGALQGASGGDPFARLLFTENHDTVGNGGARVPARIDGANPASFAARKRSMLGAVLMLTAPGVPMLFMGQESLAVAPFTSDPAPLATPTAEGARVRAFYREMIRLRRNLDGASGGLGDARVEIVHRNDASKVMAYRRFGASGEDVLVVVNLGKAAYGDYGIGATDASPWRVRMDTDLPAYGSDFTGKARASVAPVHRSSDGKEWTLPLALGPYSALVLTR